MFFVLLVTMDIDLITTLASVRSELQNLCNTKIENLLTRWIWAQ